MNEEAAAKFLAAMKKDLRPAIPDEVVDFVFGYGQLLDWLYRGDATPAIRMLRRRHEASMGSALAKRGRAIKQRPAGRPKPVGSSSAEFQQHALHQILGGSRMFLNLVFLLEILLGLEGLPRHVSGAMSLRPH